MSEISRAVLSALLWQPEFFEQAEVKSEFIESERERKIFTAAQNQFQKTFSIDVALLASEVGGNGIGTFLGSLLSGVIKISPASFSERVKKLKEEYLSRRLLRHAEDLRLKRLDYDEAAQKIREDFQGYSSPKFDIENSLKKGSELQALDLRVEYVIDKLLPASSITLFHGRGGLGKTWLSLQVGKAVKTGQELFSLKTWPRPVVYIDFENPLPMLIERVRKLDIRDVLFWHLSADPKPPKLDGPDYGLYKSLPPGSLLIFDSLRAAHDGDENSSQDMANVMGRCKELREAGFSILLIHHTGKADERIYKGSTAISDLADHVLSLYKVRRNTYEEIDDGSEVGPEDLFHFGTREKTRFEPVHVYLNFSPEAGMFTIAQDPDEEELHALLNFIRAAGQALNQTEVFTWAKNELGIGKKGRIVGLLAKAERRRLLISKKDGFRRLYEPF